jgi:septin family protein
MGSQVVLGPDEASQGTPGAPCRRYLWGTALPLDRAHSDLIVLKQLLTGHQNRAVYSLLQDSWGRAHAFHKRYEEQKREQLKAKLADGQLSGDVDAILAAVHGLDVDMSPLVDEVCGSVSRCEEQHRQRQAQEELRQAQEELQQVRDELQKAKLALRKMNDELSDGRGKLDKVRAKHKKAHAKHAIKWSD